MKMVKSLLLGSAAGLVAVAGAQAADLPVKAKAVEYVKVCSLYGAGFFYIPGTDTCLKIGGYVRADIYWDAPGGFSYSSAGAYAQAGYTRVTDELTYRARGVITADARTQTQYGTLRSYISVGAQTTNPLDAEAKGPVAAGATSPVAVGAGYPGVANSVAFLDRAYIQLAGFTIGKTVSYYDIFGFAPFISNHAPWVYGDTGAVGIFLAAYTAQFGNGLSATISLEDPQFRRRAMYDASVAGLSVAGAAPTGLLSNDQAGARFFDVVGSLRVDQAWGWAAITGAIHDASGLYVAGAPTGPSFAADNAIGFAVAAGAYVKVPGMGADTFGFQVNYGKGALGYVTNAGGFSGFDSGSNTRAVGYILDGVYGANGDVQLTSGWGFNLGYQHVWSPTLKTSIFGGYVAIDYNSTATTLICGAAATAAGCDPDFSFWQVGTRTVWTPVTNLDIGVDIMYTGINTAFGYLPAAYQDDGRFDGMLRVQRNFWP